MFKYSKQLTVAITAMLSFGILFSSQSASAYPVGQEPTVLLTQSSNLPAGATVKAKGVNLSAGCLASFYLNASNSLDGAQLVAQSATNASHETDSVSISAPNAAGTYFVVLEATNCANPADNGKVATSFTVGGKYTAKSTIWSNPLKASKNPTFYMSSRVSFGGNGTSNIPTRIVVKNPSGKVVFSKNLKSSATGRVAAHFHPKNPIPGKYTVLVTFLPTGSFSGLSSKDTTVLYK